MSKFKAIKNFKYPLDEVFRAFIKTTKKEMPRFNDKDAVGIKHSKVIKEKGAVKVKMIMEVTKFEKNKVYEVTSKIHEDIYISRYTFTEGENETTKVMLEEEQKPKNFIAKMGVILQSFTGRSKTKEKITRMEMGVTEEIEAIRSRIEKNAKK